MGRRLCGHHDRGSFFSSSSADDEFAMLDDATTASGIRPFPSVWGFVTKRRPFFFFQIIRAPPYCAKINLFFVSPLGALEPTCRFGASRNGRTSKKEAKIEAIPKSRFFPHGICLVEIFGSSSSTFFSFKDFQEPRSLVNAIQTHIGHVRADHVVTHRSRSVQIVTDQYFGMAAPSSLSATAVHRPGICDAYTVIHGSTY